MLYLYRFENYSRGVFVIYAALLIIGVGGSRASFRLIAEFVHRRRQGRRVIVYGAGEAGTIILRELLNSPTHLKMLGYIDDKPSLRGARHHGYPVIGGFDVLITLVRPEAKTPQHRVVLPRARDSARCQMLHGQRLVRQGAPATPPSPVDKLTLGLLLLFDPTFVLRRAGLIEVGGGRGLLPVADLDTLFLDLSILTVLVLLVVRRSTARQNLPYFVFILTVAVITTGLLAYVVTNFGTLFRLRLMLAVPLWMAPLALFGRRPAKTEAQQSSHRSTSDGLARAG